MAYSTGGRISNANRSVLVGEKAIQDVQAYHADIVFFSASSVGQDGEVFDCFEEEVSSRRSLIKNANKVVLLCDSTKFGGSGQYKICDVDDVDFIICDSDKKGYFKTDINAEFIYEK
jgi:DeoR family fructose operon transcriptional repressor